MLPVLGRNLRLRFGLFLAVISVFTLMIALDSSSPLNAWAADESTDNPLPTVALAPQAAHKVFLPLVSSSVYSAAPGNCETRAVWLNPTALLRGDALMSDLLNAKLNTVFVLAPPVGGNVGWTDPSLFAAFTKKAKQYGFSVHGWIANASRNGSTWADFTSASEQLAQAAWAFALINAYPYLDGVQLDYIRYDDFNYVSSTRMLGINATVSKIYSAVKSKYPNKTITAAVRHDSPESAYPSTDYIPSWYVTWYNSHPGNWYTANGTPHIPWGMRYQQDPVAWVRGGYLDAFVTMQYDLDDTLWDNQSNNWLSFVTSSGANRPYAALMGLGWYNGGTIDRHDPASVVRKIKYGRSIGIRGFSIFEFSERINGVYTSDAPLINALTIASSANNYQPPYARTIPSCLPVR